MPLPLTVTPGIVATSTTQWDAAAANLAANPQVALTPAGNITPDYLDIPALITAVGDPVRNYLQRGNFNYEDWFVPEATTAAATTTSVAAQWWCKAVGGPVTVRRIVDAPTTRSTWCAELQAGIAVTSTSFYTWVPPSAGGSFRSGSVTFSVWVKNQTLSNIFVTPYLEIALNSNERLTLQPAITGTTITVPTNVWTRLSLTVDTAVYDLSRGVAFGVMTTSLTSTGAAMRVGQAQLEVGSGPTTFARPAPPASTLAFLPVLTDEERVLGCQLVVQTSVGELRRLPAPGISLLLAQLGWNTALGVPEWRDGASKITVFTYTGADQYITVPTGITAMEVHCWGAGACKTFDRPGGVGGYTWGQFTVSAGTQFAIMVGKAGLFADDFTGTYGFAGSGGAGGMSGIFTGTSVILKTDAARALLVAGGGGAGAYVGAGLSAAAGGNGNDAGSAGGQADFLGAPDHTGSATVGGGGYNGGNYISGAGKAGTGFKHASATFGAIVATARTATVSPGQLLVVPGASVAYYQDSAGSPNRPGLVVVRWL